MSDDSRAKHDADRQLVERVCAGDESSRREFVERLACVPAMVRTKHRRMGKPLSLDELGDVVQDTFMAIWSKLPRYQGRSTIETWAYGFCVFELLKGLDKKRRRAEPVASVEEVGPPEALTVQAAVNPAHEYESLHRSLEVLGNPGNEIIRLKYFDELTFEEIAIRLEISPNTAKTWYYRGLKELRLILGDRAKEDC